MKILKKINLIFLFFTSPFLFLTSQSKAQKTIFFSGYNWKIKNATDEKVGPGSNFFDAKNVFIDKNGHLHLQLKKDKISGKWACAEVILQDSLGFGTYQFWVEGHIDKLDKNIVFGLFDYKGFDGFEENDIEFARWGNEKNNNLNYTVYPSQGTSGKSQTFDQEITLKSSYSTHRFLREPNQITFQSFTGFQHGSNVHQIASHIFNEENIILSKTTMPININLWLFKGNPPSDGKDVEIIIRQFKYTSSK